MSSSTPPSARLDDPSQPLQVWNITKPWIDKPMLLGEGPYYEPSSNSIRWVDIFGKKIYWVDLARGIESLRSVDVEDAVGVTTDIEGNDENILVAAKYGFAFVNKQSGRMRYIEKIYGDGEKDCAERMRFNDGAVDSHGRFWAGLMTDNQKYPVKNEGTVFRLDPSSTSTDGSGFKLSAQISPVMVPNGIGWSPVKQDAMYFIDSLTRTIWEYTYDPVSANLSNKKPWFVLRGSIQIPATSSSPAELFTFDKSMVPDGFQFDNTGALWVAIWGGGMVLRLEDRGEKRVVTGVVRVPVRCSSCCRFVPGGGMVITSASEEETERYGDGGPGAGRLFWADVGVEGCETWKFGRNGSRSKTTTSKI